MKVALRQRARRYIRLAEKRFKRTFSVPSIHIVPDSKEAGRACPLDWSVQLNEALLASSPLLILEQTLPHEIAHLIDMKLNLVTYAAMQRIPHHGYGWKAVMRVFNVAPCIYYEDTLDTLPIVA